MIRPARDQRGFTKIAYSDWKTFRRNIEILREDLSWSEISAAAGKVNRGWAAKAFEHRSIVAPRDLKAIQRLVNNKSMKGVKVDLTSPQEESPAANNRPSNKKDLSIEEAAVMMGYLDQLLKVYRPAHLAELLGGKSRSMVGSIIHRGGYTSRKTFDAAERLVASLPPQDLKLLKPESTAETSANTKDNVVEKFEDNMSTVVDVLPAQDPFSWLSSVEKMLLDIAILIDTEAAKVPPSFRDPYETLKDKLLNVAQDFQR